MTRRTLIRSATEKLDRAPEPVLEADLGRVAEDALRLRKVGPGIAEVAGTRRQLPASNRLADDAADRLGDVIDARRRSRRNVEDLSARALGRAGADRRVNDVADERE